jgi:hypothetical protein
LIKTIFRVAQIFRERAASARTTFPFCCPNSLKKNRKVNQGRSLRFFGRAKLGICECFGGGGRLLVLRQKCAVFRFVGVIRIPAEGESNGPHRGQFESEQCHAAQEGTTPHIDASRRMCR